MAVAAVDHQDSRVLDRVVGRDRLGVDGHAFADDRVVAQPTRKGAHQVPLGHDPGALSLPPAGPAPTLRSAIRWAVATTGSPAATVSRSRIKPAGSKFETRRQIIQLKLRADDGGRSTNRSDRPALRRC